MSLEPCYLIPNCSIKRIIHNITLFYIKFFFNQFNIVRITISIRFLQYFISFLRSLIFLANWYVEDPWINILQVCWTRVMKFSYNNHLAPNLKRGCLLVDLKNSSLKELAMIRSYYWQLFKSFLFIIIETMLIFTNLSNTTAIGVILFNHLTKKPIHLITQSHCPIRCLLIYSI